MVVVNKFELIMVERDMFKHFTKFSTALFELFGVNLFKHVFVHQHVYCEKILLKYY